MANLYKLRLLLGDQPSWRRSAFYPPGPPTCPGGWFKATRQQKCVDLSHHQDENVLPAQCCMPEIPATQELEGGGLRVGDQSRLQVAGPCFKIKISKNWAVAQ